MARHKNVPHSQLIKIDLVNMRSSRVTCQQTECRGEGVDQIVCQRCLLQFGSSVTRFRCYELFSCESSTIAHELNVFYCFVIQGVTGGTDQTSGECSLC